MTTWRDGVEYWRAWARKGSGVDEADARSIASFYEVLGRHRGSLDDEMPAELVQQLKGRK